MYVYMINMILFSLDDQGPELTPPPLTPAGIAVVALKTKVFTYNFLDAYF